MTTVDTVKRIIATTATLLLIVLALSVEHLPVLCVARLIDAEYVIKHIALNVRRLFTVVCATSLSVLIAGLRTNKNPTGIQIGQLRLLPHHRDHNR